MTEVMDCKLITETAKGTRIKSAAQLAFNDGRIEFIKSPFSLKNEIKAMKGSKWHGFDEKPRKIWSVEDCPRNRFQLSALMGNDPYEWFDRDLEKQKYERPLMDHQCDLADAGLTYHYQIWAAEMGVGKTLAAIEVIERSGVKEWFYVAPKAVLKAIAREFKKWGLDPSIKVELITYEGLNTLIDSWPKDKVPPQGVIYDESSRLKTEGSQRTRAAQKLADMIRAHFNYDGFVILMSGTPSPKTPVDWWSQAEIAWPGFLREGSPKALEQRLAFMVKEEFDSGPFMRRIGWKDDEFKCNTCGARYEDGPHDMEQMLEEGQQFHQFEGSKNEVELMFDRLIGLVIVKRKKECLSLPDKRYRKIVCKPNKSVMRVAQAIVNSAESAMQGNLQLRELSDGFQYREVEDGKVPCRHCAATGEVAEWYDREDKERTFSAIDMLSAEKVQRLEKHMIECPACEGTKEVKKLKRVTKEVPCPKDDALNQLLEENDEHGRIVIFAGFTGSVDRCVRLCTKKNWDVVRCDGRGFEVFKCDSNGDVKILSGVDALDYWADRENLRVAFVAHPESGGMGLTLTEACMAVFWSNSFKPEYRTQSEDRIHRPGIDENLGATIVDLIHLPSDDRVLQVIQQDRHLELMTMGEFKDVLDIEVEGEELTLAA